MSNFEKINYALENLDMLQFDGNDETRITKAYEKHLKSRPAAVATEIYKINPTGAPTATATATATVPTNALKEQLVAPTAADEEIDLVLKDNADLINPEWKGWHAKKIKKHGIQWYLEQCSIARKEGRDPKKCLTWLLNK